MSSTSLAQFRLLIQSVSRPEARFDAMDTQGKNLDDADRSHSEPQPEGVQSVITEAAECLMHAAHHLTGYRWAHQGRMDGDKNHLDGWLKSVYDSMASTGKHPNAQELALEAVSHMDRWSDPHHFHLFGQVIDGPELRRGLGEYLKAQDKPIEYFRRYDLVDDAFVPGAHVLDGTELPFNDRVLRSVPPTAETSHLYVHTTRAYQVPPSPGK